MAKTPPAPTAGRWPLLLLAGAAVWWMTMRRKDEPKPTTALAGENRYLQPIQAGEDPYTRRKSDMAAQISTAFVNPTPGGI